MLDCRKGEEIMDYHNYNARLDLIFEKKNNKAGFVDNYLVRIKYKYNWEKEYTEELLYYSYDGKTDQYFVEYDWWEGQEDVIIVGVKSMTEVFDELDWSDKDGTE